MLDLQDRDDLSTWKTFSLSAPSSEVTFTDILRQNALTPAFKSLHEPLVSTFSCLVELLNNIEMQGREPEWYIPPIKYGKLP